MTRDTSGTGRAPRPHEDEGGADGRPSTGQSSGAEVERGTVRTNGVETYYERRGDGPPVVFVHGMFMDTAMWEAQAEALSDDFTTVTYDVRGHGHTGGSDRERRYGSDAPPRTTGNAVSATVSTASPLTYTRGR